MSKPKTYVLPASGHSLWVAFFDPGLLDDSVEDENLPQILEVHPVIGWIYTHEDRIVEPAFELTPDGPVYPGISRYLGEDKEEATNAGMAGLMSEWERRKAVRARRAEEQGGA